MLMDADILPNKQIFAQKPSIWSPEAKKNSTKFNLGELPPHAKIQNGRQRYYENLTFCVFDLQACIVPQFYGFQV